MRIIILAQELEPSHGTKSDYRPVAGDCTVEGVKAPAFRIRTGSGNVKAKSLQVRPRLACGRTLCVQRLSYWDIVICPSLPQGDLYFDSEEGSLEVGKVQAQAVSYQDI